jgi:cobalamin biosynthesis protein CbiG
VYNENIPRGVTIQLPKPKMLQIERESEYMNTVATLINTLKELGIPEDYLKRKYLPFDWEEVERIDTEANIDKNLEKKNEDEMGLGGGYGGGMDSGIGGNVGF